MGANVHKIALYVYMLLMTGCYSVQWDSIINDIKDPRGYDPAHFSKAMRWHQDLLHSQFLNRECRKMPQCELYFGKYPLI